MVYDRYRSYRFRQWRSTKSIIYLFCDESIFDVSFNTALCFVGVYIYSTKTFNIHVDIVEFLGN